MFILFSLIFSLFASMLCIQCGRSRYDSKRNSSGSVRSMETSARESKQKPHKPYRPTIDSAACDGAAANNTENKERMSVKPLRQMDQESELSRSLISPSTVN